MFGFAPLAHAGFGVSPGRIIEDRLVRGTSIERVIYLVQGFPEKDLHIKVDVEDNEIASWITLSPGKDIVIPKGTQQFPLTVSVKVPEDADLGVYSNFIRISTVADDDLKVKEGTSGVSILVGARVDVDLTVGQGVIYEYAIRGVDLRHISEIDFPTADISIENKGNVKAGPAEATFELFNKFGDIRLAYVQGLKILPVEAFRTEGRVLEFPVPVRLSVGEYWGMVKLYDDKGAEVFSYKDIFNVRESTLWDKYAHLLWYVLGGIILVALLFLTGRWTGRSRNINTNIDTNSA